MKPLRDNKELIRAFLTEKIARAKNINQVHDHDNLIENGIIDSLGIMQLVTYLEDTFGKKVRDEDIIPDNFESVDVISSYITRL